MAVAISIIVPIYKSEAFLHRAIDSLLAQTFQDFELILVDDGSPDRSGEICDEYAAKDPRVRVIHKSNGGVSSARQAGLEAATGDYTIHADPDDWVEPTMLEELYAVAQREEADMVLCDFILEEQGRSTYYHQVPRSLNPQEIQKQLFLGQIMGASWNKLIRRSTLAKYQIQFPTGVNFGEDLYVVAVLLFHPIRVAYLPKAFYHYIRGENDNSLVKNVDLSIAPLLINRFELILSKKIYEAYAKPYFISMFAMKAFTLETCNNKLYRQTFSPYRSLILRSKTLRFQWKIILWLASYGGKTLLQRTINRLR